MNTENNSAETHVNLPRKPSSFCVDLATELCPQTLKQILLSSFKLGILGFGSNPVFQWLRNVPDHCHAERGLPKHRNPNKRALFREGLGSQDVLISGSFLMAVSAL